MMRCTAPPQRCEIVHLPPRGSIWYSGRFRARGAAVLAAALALGACDFPTAMPIFETRLVIPEAGTTFGVDELLPGSVTVVGGSFRLAVPGASLMRTLGEMCGQPCTVFAGQQVPKPAFADTFFLTLGMPADVVSSVLTSGSAAVVISHSFGFDPLRPAGSTMDGTMTVVLRNAGRQLGTATIDQAFPSGSTVTRTVQLEPGVVTGDIEVVIGLTSPAGDPVTIDPNASLNISVVPGQLDVSQATVRVQDRQITAQTVTLDLSDIDDVLADRVRRGAIVLTIDNPFALTGTLQVQVQGAAVAPKTVQIAAGETTQRIEFTEAELKQMLGRVVTLSISGPVSATGGVVTVMPGQQVTITTLLDLIFALGA
jgi:hypothetical protein